MGNAESQVVKNVDKRTARREHAGHFKKAIACHRMAHGEDRGPSMAAPFDDLGDGRFRVCVRKRPIFDRELEQGEFDVISTSGISEHGGKTAAGVVVHDARMQADMIKMYMTHHGFHFDGVFGDHCSNTDVYEATTMPLVRSVVQDGLNATVMMYGQTGSGKTYTMTAIQQHSFGDLFRFLGDEPVTLSFVELIGDRCNDMLHGGSPVSLHTAADGCMHPFPCVEVQVSNAEDLSSLIAHANSLRATAATGVHDASSRSHAVCRLYCPGGGTLTLVDLAGSEHRIDSDEHNAQRRREGSMINASLSALKDCFRAHAAGSQFIPYRNNRLTQLLRGCFATPRAGPAPCTVLIATVSPSSKDTEHSLNTIRHACIMDGQGEGGAAGSSHLIGGTQVREELGGIDVCGIARERFEQRKKLKEGMVQRTQAARRDAPAHQSKDSNVVDRKKLDRQGLGVLRPELRAALITARDPTVLRETGRQRLAGAAEAPSGERRRRTSPSDSPPIQRPRLQRTGSMPGARRPADVRSPVECTPNPTPEYGHDEVAACIADPDPPFPSPPLPGPPLPDPPRRAVAECDERQTAEELWQAFREGGRHCRVWSGNDLRLINVHIVPTLPAHIRPQALPWRDTDRALDELRVAAEALPADRALLGDVAMKPAPRPGPKPRPRREAARAERAEQPAHDAPGRGSATERAVELHSLPLGQQVTELEGRIALGGSHATVHGLKRLLSMKKAQLRREELARQQQQRQQQQPEERGLPDHAAACGTADQDGDATGPGDFGPLGGPPVMRKHAGRRVYSQGGARPEPLRSDARPLAASGEQHGRLAERECRQQPQRSPQQFAACFEETEPLSLPPVRAEPLGVGQLPAETAPSPHAPVRAIRGRRRDSGGLYGAAAAPWGNQYNDP